jgi:hypothetical protein
MTIRTVLFRTDLKPPVEIAVLSISYKISTATSIDYLQASCGKERQNDKIAGVIKNMKFCGD